MRRPSPPRRGHSCHWSPRRRPPLGADRNGDTRCVQPRRVGIRGVVGIMIVGRHVQRSTDEHRHSGLLERAGNLPGLATSRDHRLELQFLGDRQGVENLGAMVGQEDHWLLALRIGDKRAEARIKGRGSHTLGPGLGHDLAVSERPAKVLADCLELIFPSSLRVRTTLSASRSRTRTGTACAGLRASGERRWEWSRRALRDRRRRAREEPSRAG